MTFTGTTTSTHTVQGAVTFFGFPWYISVALVLVIGLVASVFLRTNARPIPVKILWVYKNGAALLLNAKKDIGGIFIEVLGARGKKLTALQEEGLPVEVREVPRNKKAYILREYTDRDRGKWLGANPGKTLPQEMEKEQQSMVYYDVALGGLKHMKLYAAIEGEGKTISFLEKVAKNGDATKTGGGSASIIYEEKNAAQEAFRILADAMKGGLRSILLPFGAGIAIGIAGLFIILLFAGVKI